MRTRLQSGMVGVLVGILVLTLSGCASLRGKFPPRLPDGSLDLDTLIDYADGGIQADCQLGFSPTLCQIGGDTVRSVRAALAAHRGESPLALYRALQVNLEDSAVRWPEIRPYVQWLIDLLKTVIGPTPSAQWRDPGPFDDPRELLFQMAA